MILTLFFPEVVYTFLYIRTKFSADMLPRPAGQDLHVQKVVAYLQKLMCHTPKDHNLNTHCYENFQSYVCWCRNSAMVWAVTEDDSVKLSHIQCQLVRPV